MSNKSLPEGITRAGIGMGTGLVVGGILGLISGNLILFAGGGMILGLCIGLSSDHGTMGINL